jgi:hypothetical protein
MKINKPIFVIFVFSCLIGGCFAKQESDEGKGHNFSNVGVIKSVTIDNEVKQEKPIGIDRYNGPQDIICRSGGTTTYEHNNVILYRNIYSDTRNIDVYEQDTQEKVIVSGDCNIRPHK